MAPRPVFLSPNASVRTRTFLVAALVALVLFSMPGVATGAQPTKQFVGTTSQTTTTHSFHLTIDVDATRVGNLQIDAQVLRGPSACALNSPGGSTFVFSGALAIANHRYAGRLKNAAGDTVIIHGRVSVTSVTGTFRVLAAGVTPGTGPCNSGVVTFIARAGSAPRGGTVYSGTVGAGYLITFRVPAHAARVEDLVVAFYETCNGPPRDLATTFRFKSLVIASGEFTGTSTDSFGPTQRQTVRINGTFSGGVAAGQVSDTSVIAGSRTCTQTSPFVATVSSQTGATAP